MQSKMQSHLASAWQASYSSQQNCSAQALQGGAPGSGGGQMTGSPVLDSPPELLAAPELLASLVLPGSPVLPVVVTTAPVLEASLVEASLVAWAVVLEAAEVGPELPRRRRCAPWRR